MLGVLVRSENANFFAFQYPNSHYIANNVDKIESVLPEHKRERTSLLPIKSDVIY